MKTNFTLTIVMVLAINVTASAAWTSYTSANSPLQTDYITSLNVEPDGKILIGTQGRGLYVKDGYTWQVFNSNTVDVPINYAFSTAFDGDTIFIGSASGDLDTQPLGEGLSALNLSDSTWVQMNLGLEISPIITDIVITPAYRAVATYGGGLTLYNDNGWIRYQTDFRTVFIYADSQQTTYKVDTGTYIPTNYIRRLDYDSKNGILWIATLSGAVSYNGTDWTTYDLSNSGLPSNRIQLVKADTLSGKVYFATYGFGLGEKYGDTWTVYNTGNSPLVSNHLHALEIRPDNGDLWIGTGYAISVISQDGLWSSYIPADSGLVWGDHYSDIAFDSTGNVWVATYGGGIAFMPIVIEVEPEYDSLSVDIQSLKMFLREPNNSDILWFRAQLEPIVDLNETDTVAAKISTIEGAAYEWQKTFADFHCLFNWGNREIYLAYDNHSAMLLTYQTNLDLTNLYLLDWQASIDHDYVNSDLATRIHLGSYVGYDTVYVGQGDPANDSDTDTLEVSPGDVFLSSDYYPVIVDIDDDDIEIPASISAPINYPNPFNPQTTISFSIDRPALVKLNVYDILGRSVSSYENYLNAGVHSIEWDGSDKASGVYYYVVSYDGQIFKGNMTLIK